MKILYVSPSYYPAFQYGGPIQSNHLLCTELVRLGFVVDVLTTGSGLSAHRDLLLKGQVDYSGVKVRYLKHFGYDNYTFSPGLLIEAFKRSKDYDLVHISGVWNFTVLAASMAALYHRKPYLIKPHGALYRKAFQFRSEKLKKLYYHLVARHYLKRAAALHFTTEDEKQSALSHLNLPGRTLVIPNGIDLNSLKGTALPRRHQFTGPLSPLQHSPYLLFMGRLSPEKGLDLLLEAFLLLQKHYPHFKLVLAGADNRGYGLKLQEQVREGPLAEKVIFPGMLLGEDKHAALSGAHLLVLPSYSDSFGMAAVEAMASGIPVVVTDQVGIHREISRYDAGIVTRPTAQSLHLGLKSILDDSRRRKEIAKNGRKMAEECYNIKAVSKAMVNAYREVAGTGAQ